MSSCVEGRHAVTGRLLEVGSPLDEQSNRRRLVVVDSVDERSLLPECLGVNVGPGVKEYPRMKVGLIYYNDTFVKPNKRKSLYRPASKAMALYMMKMVPLGLG